MYEIVEHCQQQCASFGTAACEPGEHGAHGNGEQLTAIWDTPVPAGGGGQKLALCSAPTVLPASSKPRGDTEPVPVMNATAAHR